MKQYNAIKAKHPGTVLLFRVGDFYETFGEDAVKVSEILGIVLTRRNNGTGEMELAGFPHHSLDTYLPRLVRAGQRVAVCDQLEDPKQAIGIVKRGVTELVTPGVAFSDKMLDSKESNYLAALHFSGKEVGLAFVEVSTGEFFCLSGSIQQAEKLMNTLKPAEVLVGRKDIRQFKEEIGEKFYISRLGGLGIPVRLCAGNPARPFQDQVTQRIWCRQGRIRCDRRRRGLALSPRKSANADRSHRWHSAV